MRQPTVLVPLVVFRDESAMASVGSINKAHRSICYILLCRQRGHFDERVIQGVDANGRYSDVPQEPLGASAAVVVHLVLEIVNRRNKTVIEIPYRATLSYFIDIKNALFLVQLILSLCFLL